ncbi:hypothetical protein DY120_00980 [Apilactobacillus micheneri]|uniref:Uncharacterized protein n=1 Tax=Apilactobacillus micheneri TaxID=1899430 RepID=A0ABY2YY99_9LACO|nr:hypothetical protein [Apilactobacillus micheneri]TPR26300.1 hypothetical protein DY114_00980 [Apilactobacillus micheneri]TPR27054.1 hypothetical protein DY111_00980 [Apilactobacillus micheneri]TPR27912.1 hypothetical protein DY113_04755 [Apilactobacillus micheneri]TPR31817.1 hypothetical protein DY117_00980 [Apilactobacillus micheneri]TPR32221.1 hypothetical protein DY120_00980 [Apilactobacillus micheneri]
MSILDALVSGSVFATFLTYVFNSINNDKNAIHNESEWRSDLYEISKKENINKENVEMFRTCISSTRGGCKYKFDKRFSDRYMTLDDIALIYYHYLINEYNFKVDSNNHNNNDCSEKSYHVLNEEDSIVFRQLCRMLLKSDWEIRNKNNNLLNKIKCIVKTNETEKKAVSLLCSLSNYEYIIRLYADCNQKRYIDTIKGNDEYQNKIIYVDLFKSIFILSFIIIN